MRDSECRVGIVFDMQFSSLMHQRDLGKHLDLGWTGYPVWSVIWPKIRYGRIFSLTSLKLSGRISDNLVFYIKQH